MRAKNAGEVSLCYQARLCPKDQPENRNFQSIANGQDLRLVLRTQPRSIK